MTVRDSIPNLGACAALALAAALAGCGGGPTGTAKGPSASAAIKGFADPGITGLVRFTTLPEGGLMIRADVSGLKPGQRYGAHVHEKGNCAAPDSSGAHFRSGTQGHGDPLAADGLHHDGDLPNLQADSLGVGHFHFRATSLAIVPGPLNAIGRAVIVHAGPDDYLTQPTGNSGARIACGVIAAD